MRGTRVMLWHFCYLVLLVPTSTIHVCWGGEPPLPYTGKSVLGQPAPLQEEL